MINFISKMSFALLLNLLAFTDHKDFVLFIVAALDSLSLLQCLHGQWNWRIILLCCEKCEICIIFLHNFFCVWMVWRPPHTPGFEKLLCQNTHIYLLIPFSMNPLDGPFIFSVGYFSWLWFTFTRLCRINGDVFFTFLFHILIDTLPHSTMCIYIICT